MRRLVRDLVAFTLGGVLIASISAVAQIASQEDPHKIIRQQLMEYAAAVANLQVALRECQATQAPAAPKGQEKK